jgi:hypothetical protein
MLINFLTEALLENVIEKIFSYLDFDSLMKSESVSEEWCELLQNRRIWRDLLDHNVIVFLIKYFFKNLYDFFYNFQIKFFPSWKRVYSILTIQKSVQEEAPDFYRSLCFEIENSIQVAKACTFCSCSIS